MIGLLMSVGNFGAVIATTPLAWAAGTWGWRVSFFLIGGITLGLAFVTITCTRDYTGLHASAPASVASGDSAKTGGGPGVIRILASLRFWVVAAIFFGIYGTLITLQGLWATPFLMAALGIERVYASNLNMLIPVGVIIGSPFIGWLAGRLEADKAHVLCVIIAIYAMTWVGIIFFFNLLGTLGMAIVLLVMGIVAGGFISILWGFIRATTPSETMGLTSGMLNPAPFFGVAVFQVITGVILDRAGRVGENYSLTGFQNALLVCLGGIFICFVLSLILNKVRKHEHQL
jgi:sugar phosphate permease